MSRTISSYQKMRRELSTVQLKNRALKKKLSARNRRIRNLRATKRILKERVQSLKGELRQVKGRLEDREEFRRSMSRERSILIEELHNSSQVVLDVPAESFLRHSLPPSARRSPSPSPSPSSSPVPPTQKPEEKKEEDKKSCCLM
ncbi:hypothetical protein QR680_017930 [Steinernema hermaphroditum]|uniref:Uncharacterized protein n=1 Tax=Steinernema hermaphroditum TaxID=289476 RepID=A0AA39HGB6_9BILA|nr:hypothetical protein QR680_017930 [Steinernema hermaphroditum]